ncbi:MAG: formylmethanofuran dehydrogenase subunit E family protein [Deltaproteobacteria bacterium]|nr:formylmethanofuran dehydrogenase subunit E family protein [Deltaproteobacteria bacterium]
MREICGYTVEEYIHLIESFHGYLAPGLLIGGFMIDEATRELPEGEIFDAICETRVCLPDAVQILTPCTVGNGWLKIFDFGRFAVTVFQKNTGDGLRVFVDAQKLAQWGEIDGWFLKKTARKEQNTELLIEQIKQADTTILSRQKVRIKEEHLKKQKTGAVGICPICGESYPTRDGEMCRSCAGGCPYVMLADKE